GTPLRDGHRYRVVGFRLRPIAGRSVAGEQTVDQDPRTAPGVAAHHETLALLARCRRGFVGGEALEPAIPAPEDDPLQATIAAYKRRIRGQKRSVVVAGLRIHEVNWRHIAFPALGGRKPTRAPDIHRLDHQTLCLQPLDHLIETDAMTANDDQVSNA